MLRKMLRSGCTNLTCIFLLVSVPGTLSFLCSSLSTFFKKGWVCSEIFLSTMFIRHYIQPKIYVFLNVILTFWMCVQSWAKYASKYVLSFMNFNDTLSIFRNMFIFKVCFYVHMPFLPYICTSDKKYMLIWVKNCF